MFGSKEQRVDYKVYEQDGCIVGYLLDMGNTSLRGNVIYKGYLTYKKPWYSRRWRIDGPAGIEPKKPSNWNPYLVGTIAAEQFRRSLRYI